MKAIVIAAILLLLLPAALFAEGTIGVFFDGPQMHYYPQELEEFVGYVYAHAAPCQLTAVEFMVEIPMGILPGVVEVPEGSLILGSPTTGLSITYWPPLDIYETGYVLLASIPFLATDVCIQCGGTLADEHMQIVPVDRYPLPPFLGGTCWPGNEKVEMVGLTSIICPQYIAVEEESWGAIKSLFR
jgi:hypothetical protein